jgi:polyhydroxyalkanoate synthesis regulator phasin
VGEINMFDFIRKSVLAGIGAVVLTKEKVQEATRSLVEEGKMSTDEAERLADDLVKSGERQWDELNHRISEMMKRWVDNMDLVRDREFMELKARVEMLEQRVSLMESERLRTTEHFRTTAETPLEY